MRQKIGQLFVSAAILLAPVLGDAATRSLNCGTGTINAFLPRLRSGDTLLVSGTCNENIVFSAARNNITLDGQGTATINGSDPTANTINIRGHNITIKGFNITGGSRGILVSRGGEATIDGNNIHSTGSDGVQVSQASSARIINNSIHNNPEDGIVVLENSTAHIGILTGSDTSASPNTIQNNGGNGINVVRTASVRVVGNTISGNTGNGINVGDNSHGDLASNVINNNVNGVNIFRSGHVRLGRDTGSSIFELPNSTTVNNTGNGIRCRIGGSADGRVGTLNGTAAQKDFALAQNPTCVDSLQ